MEWEKIKTELSSFDPKDPSSWFRERGVNLRVWKTEEILFNKRIAGAWHPSTRTVELFDCADHARGEDLLEALFHEMIHVVMYSCLNLYEAGESISENQVDIWAKQYVSEMDEGSILEGFTQLCFIAEDKVIPSNGDF